MQAFIVRPFGQKNGVDFDKVDRELISPALDRLQIAGRTTQEIARAGNIRADMFQLLLTADFVVADISIHNANVFYELGVRHALRASRTFLLRAAIDEVPFDLKTDRYLSYDPDNPAASLDALIAALDQTLHSETIDSPVYSMLPGLSSPDPAAFIVVPKDFREEVKRARTKQETGDLRFLASELPGLAWRREGMRVIGEAQFHLCDYGNAAETWEWVRGELPADWEANLRLGTIYQKLGDLVRSDEALERVVSIEKLESENLAEAHALLGSNAKKRWIADWSAAADLVQRQKEALRSPFLFSALENYRKGFETELSHYYSGLNALALLIVISELATIQSDVWRERFEDQDEADRRFKEYRNLKSQISGAVEFSLGARRQRLAGSGEKDDWLALAFADYGLMCERANAWQLYRDALAGLDPFIRQTARRQVDLLGKLGILTRSVEAIAPLFGSAADPAGPAAQPGVLLFTGHRIDNPDRAKPRFPAGKEAVARQAIMEAVRREMRGEPANVTAIAGGASGGDLLFHEVCEELGIGRRLYLVTPREQYVKASVAPSGPAWVERFDHQMASAPSRVYQSSDRLPLWLQDKKDYNVWQRSNAWMLYNALTLGGTGTALIALWDGKGGDGPGGTEHMIRVARDRGARTIILDTNQLFGL